MKAKTFTFLNFGKLLILGLALFLTTSASAADNLLVNPGFEEGLTGWDNWMPDNNSIETTAENVNSGSKSIALKPMSWSGAGFGQSIAGFKAGETYTLSASAKIFGVLGDSQADIFFDFKDANGKRTLLVSTERFTNTEKFEMHSVSAIVPDNAATMAVGVWFGGADNVVMYIDDFKLVKGLGGLSIANASFEAGLSSWDNWMPDNNKMETAPENVHTGSQSVALKPLASSGAGLGQAFTNGFTAGESYTLSAYGKVFGDIGSNQANIFIQFVDAAGKKVTNSSPNFSKADGFEMQSVTAVIPEGTASITVGVWFGGPDNSVLYMDDFELIKNLVIPSILKNSGFEDGLVDWVNWMPANNVVETDLANVHSGKKAIALKPVAWSGAGFGQSIYTGFTVGESYTLTAYGKILGDIQGKQANISMQFLDANGLATTFDAPNFSSTAGFEMKSVSAVVPEGTVEVAVSVWFGGPDNTILYFDDFKFDKTVIIEGLVKNASFEKGLDKWGNWMPDNNIIETSAENVHSGKQSIALKPVNSSGAGFGQGIETDLLAGDKFTLTAYGKVLGDITGQQANISIQFIDGDGVKTLVDAPNFSKTDGFEKQSVTATIPEGAVSMNVLVWFGGADGTVLYVDDFELVKGDGTTGIKNLELVNGSLSVYPNPLSGNVLNVNTKGMSGIRKMNIIDISGKVILSKIIKDTDNQVINLDNSVRPGMYILNVSSMNSSKSIKLIIR